MKILRHKNFLRNYKKRIISNKKLNAQFKERFQLFLIDPNNPLLKDHQLIGRKQQYRSFSITGDIRVIYQFINEETILLYDIGTHNQVY